MIMTETAASPGAEPSGRDRLFRVLPIAGLMLLSAGSAAQACSPGPSFMACMAAENAQHAAQEAAQQAAQRAAIEAAQQAAQRAAQQAAQRAAQQAAERAAQEEAQRAAQEAAQRAAQETAQRAAQETARREAAQRAAQETARREAAQRAAQETARREAAQRAAQEAARREAAQQAAQEGARRQAAQEKAQENARRQEDQAAAQEIARRQAARDGARPPDTQSPELRPPPERDTREQHDVPGERTTEVSLLPRRENPYSQPRPGELATTTTWPTPRFENPVTQREGSQRVPVQGTNGRPLPGSETSPATPPARPGEPPLLMPPFPQKVQAQALSTIRPIVVDRMTTITPMEDHRGFAVTRQNLDGSQLVVNQTHGGNGNPMANAYILKQNLELGTQTRIYADGHRIILGPDFVTRGARGRPTYTVHSDGLREALLPDGRKWFAESKLQLPDRDGHLHEGVQRTVYAGRVGGYPVAQGKPLVQTFVVAPINGVRTIVYLPRPLPPYVFRTVLVPFWQPVAVAAACPFCPSDSVVFDDLPDNYTDPTDLLTDMQIAGAAADGMDEINAEASIPPAPDAQDWAVQFATLQLELNSAAADHPDLKEQLDEQPKLMPDPANACRPVAARPVPTPIHVTAEVQQQLRREVKEDVIEQAQQNPLMLNDLIASGEAKQYIFQTSDRVEVTETSTGAACDLTSGDMISFASLPSDEDATAHMKVVTSRGTSCKADVVVDVAVSDLQDMLNAFSERLENNMTKVHQWVVSAAEPR
jgi:hypothetical protein